MTSILRLPRVIELTGLSRSTIYELISKGSFPPGFPLGCRAVGWTSVDVAEWIDRRRDRDAGVTSEAAAAERGGQS
jgi:prophage regulatory protein